MRLRSYFLAAGGATVVIGGIYLFLQVRDAGESGPTPEAVAAAQARHDQEHAAAVRLRPPAADRAPGTEARRGAGLPRPRSETPTEVAVADPPLADRLRAPGAMQPPIDPDAPDLASAMTETNKMYDRGDYEGARALALKLLTKDDTNVRMLRVVVSSSCIMGDADVATQYWQRLPAPDQQQMSVRCARYQVTFPGATGLPLEK